MNRTHDAQRCTCMLALVPVQWPRIRNNYDVVRRTARARAHTIYMLFTMRCADMISAALPTAHSRRNEEANQESQQKKIVGDFGHK